jgi:hypothetical protein
MSQFASQEWAAEELDSELDELFGDEDKICISLTEEE